MGSLEYAAVMGDIESEDGVRGQHLRVDGAAFHAWRPVTDVQSLVEL